MTVAELEQAIEAVPFIANGPLWLRRTQQPTWLNYRADCLPWGHGCRQCGKAITWRSATCSHRCSRLFGINHFWQDARQHAAFVKNLPGYTLEGYLAGTWDYRAQWYELRTCPKCERTFSAHALEVNHIHPLNGNRASFGCGHHQDNLEAICHDCHVEITTQQRRAGLIGPPKAPSNQLELSEVY